MTRPDSSDAPSGDSTPDQARYRTMFQAAGIALVVIDASGRVVEANREAGRAFGRAPDELLSLLVTDLLEAEGGHRFQGLLAKLSPDGEINFESQGRRSDGSTFDLEFIGHGISLDGQPHLLAAIRDVSARRRLEANRRELDQARELFQSVFMFHPYPLLLVRREEGHILAVNVAFEQVWGYPASQVLNQPAHILYARPESRQEMLEELRSKGRLTEFQTTGKKGDGSHVPCALSVVPIELSGRPMLIVTAIDLTERTQLEAQLRQAQKMEAIGRLAGGVAHDFNNLLAVISGHSELALNRLDGDSPLRGDLEAVRRAGERAAALTGQLLAFSRRQMLEPRVLNLNQVVSSVEEMLTRLIGEHIELIIVLDPDLANIKADPSQIEQVIVNLAVNARDAMPGGGRLVIHTANLTIAPTGVAQQGTVPPGTYVSLTVRDTGIGMDDETRSRLFDPFFTTKEPGKGTGLGLATVYGIVRQSGGHLLVDSQPGQGAVFQILLPSVAEDARTVEAEPLLDVHARGTERVLLVEDEDMVRDYAREVLTLFGYEVIEAAGGEEALETLQTGPRPDLLLTDVVMPKMSGPELARIIRDQHPEVKIVYMSGYATEEMGRRPDLPATFIAKPFTPEELARQVRQALDNE